MRLKCLVLDHDDTVVASTAAIHFPSFQAYLDRVRPGTRYTLEEYIRKNFDPGILAFFTGELGFTQQEIDDEVLFWQEYVKSRVPESFPGVRELLERWRAGGGTIAVVSHSMRRTIERDYRHNSLPQPDYIYGWDLPQEQRKPNAWPLEQVWKRLGLLPEQLLVVDDLKPGFDMAQLCGVDFAAAGWANDVPEIESFMRRHCKYYFKTVQELDRFLEADV